MDAAWGPMVANETPSWYLHPLVARQKRDVHLQWISRWRAQTPAGPLLKTDLFEEAYGDDTTLPWLLGQPGSVVAIDWLPRVVTRARERFPNADFYPLAADCRTLPFATASMAVVLSPSTLDHFPTAQDFDAAIAEIARVLEPGGLLLITLDNPSNPLYWLLRAMSRVGWTPFPIGYTPHASTLDAHLHKAGLEVLGRELLIHNPRLLSTALFVGLQRMLGRRADPVIARLLTAFASLAKLPTRGLSACFIATCARKRSAGDAAPPVP